MPALENANVHVAPKARSARTRVLLLAAHALLGCGDGDETEPLVGSGTVVERVEGAMFVERVKVSLPFHAVVANGEPRQVLLRGEDNLLDQISVEEVEPGEWHISAPEGLTFEQHEDVRVEIPYLEMVFISLSGDVELEDHPSGIWRSDAGE
jgi:hypothetical protein